MNRPADAFGSTAGAKPGRWSFTKRFRLGVVAASIGVMAYSIAVLMSVATSGDIGLRCVFGTGIKESADGDWSRVPLAVPADLRAGLGASDVFSPDPPRVDDRLLGIGSIRVTNYHDYVRALRRLATRTGVPVEVRWRAEAGLVPESAEALAAPVRFGHVRIARPPMRTYLWSLIWFLQEIVVFAIGVRVYWTRPRDVSARVFFWLCVATVGAFMGGYHWSRIVIHQPLILLFAAFAVFVPVLSLHFYLVFPRPNPVYLTRRRLVMGLLYGLPVAALAAMWSLMIWAMLDPDSRNVETALFILRNLALVYVGFAVVLFMLCLTCLIYSFRRARNGAERNQVQWILLATLLAFLPITYLLWNVHVVPARLGLSISAWPMFIVSLLYTCAYAVSITRFKLMQAEEYLNRGLIYFLVTIGAGLLYSAILVGTTLVLNDSLAANRTGIGAVVVGATALVILILWEAARQRFQKIIDRRFNREKYKLDQAMKKMGQAVGSLVDRPTLGRRLLEAASEVLRLEWGAVYMADGGETPQPYTLAACWGPEPDDKAIEPTNPVVVRLREAATVRVSHALTSPSDVSADALIALGGELAAGLEQDGRLDGILVLGPKRSGLPFEDDEVAFLGALASVAMLALRSADIQTTLEVLNGELRDKVEKIAEQQRRILILQDQLAGRRGARGDEPRTQVEPADDAVFRSIKGSSRAVARMIEVARKVATGPSAVLIRGESGTGKELLAEAIHNAGPRTGKPFVKVHCAALSQNLLESELFGHVKGAFTDAHRDRIGRFQQADGGTLFLDEIGDINWEVQTKLLRVLQEMQFEPVGSSHPVKVDVRIVAATHQDLEGLIRAGKFREDLYYRLNVISIHTPALRERKDDVFELAVHFLNEHARRVGKAVTHLDEATVEALVAYDWPGNIRELQNVIERAVVLADGPAVSLEDLPDEIRRPGRRRARVLAGVSAPVRRPAAIATAPDRAAEAAMGEEDDPEFVAYERRRLIDALEVSSGNKSEAARLLGMPRSTFFSKMKKYRLM